ncbi:MAG: GAF domain-containing protein [Salinivirgaceae bacterium]|nr:GAF domain-containing protein [Salinivirgaceae bacterium]
MDELLKYRKKITWWTILLVATCVAAVITLLAAAPGFGKNQLSLILLVIILVQILVALKIGLMGSKITSIYIKSEEERAAAAQINDEQYEKEVDQKMKETTDTGFDLNDLLAKTGKQSDWKSFGDSLLYALSKQLDMAVGIVFKCTDDEFSPAATFAYYSNEAPHSFKMGEGLSGQVAKDKKPMFLNELPSKSLVIVSGLGQIEVNNLAIIPILKDDNAVGLIEIATFKPFENGFVNKIDEISNAIGGVTPQ